MNKTYSTKDSEILHSMIFHLLIELNIRTPDREPSAELNRVLHDLKNVEPTDPINDTVRVIEKYKTIFLKEPHEKSS